MKDVTRSYEQKRRAVQQEETRERIVDATIELHRTIGPTATTVSEIAKRAGVGRVTVYRHFPDEPTLSRACSGKYLTANPLPEPERWSEIADPTDRLRTALRETYAYHRANEAMFEHVLADARDHPVLAPYHEHWHRVAHALTTPFDRRGKERRLLEAGIALALSFDTWRALALQGVSDRDAAELMMRLATCS
jgi:AcrR family transcriptional regulator